MPTHNLQEEPESTIGSKPEELKEDEEERHARERELAHGVRMRREEGEETEDGREIRERQEFEEGGRPPPERLEP